MVRMLGYSLSTLPAITPPFHLSVSCAEHANLNPSLPTPVNRMTPLLNQHDRVRMHSSLASVEVHELGALLDQCASEQPRSNPLQFCIRKQTRIRKLPSHLTYQAEVQNVLT